MIGDGATCDQEEMTMPKGHPKTPRSVKLKKDGTPKKRPTPPGWAKPPGRREGTR